MDRQLDVLVVGAGPTGLTLACDLARRGLRVRIIDASEGPFAGSRGKGIQPRTLEVFEDLGVIDEVLSAGGEYPRLRIHAGSVSFHWSLMRREQRTPEVPYPNAWLLPQARTEGILRARLATLGVEVEFGCALREFTQDDAGVTVRLARGATPESLRASYLVGADGGHSTVRKALGVTFRGARLASPRAVVGDVRADGVDRDAWHVWPRGKWGAVALCPLPQSDLFQLFAQVDAAVTAPPSAADLSALIASALGRRAPVLRDPTWLSLYQPNARLADHYSLGRVLLAGDAAHVHPPAGGQGLNLGVQDAYNLGWKLAAVLGGASDSLIDSYEEERRPLAAATLNLSSKLLGSRWQRRGSDTQQLKVHYRGSSLCAPGAGDRMPDALLLDARDREVRLFDLLRGPDAVLLAFGTRAAHAAARASEARALRVVRIARGPGEVDGAMLDRDARLHRRCGTPSGGLVLIRPDGYIALKTNTSDEEALRAALARIGHFAGGSAPASELRAGQYMTGIC